MQFIRHDMDIQRPTNKLSLLGQKNIQNSLLVGFLQQRLPLDCEMLDSSQEVMLGSLPEGAVVCLDGASLRSERCIQVLELIQLQHSPSQAVIYNLEPGWPHEQLIQWPEVAGFFYKGASHAHMAKGIMAILNGEVWFSRRLMNSFMSRYRKAPAKTPAALYSLTKREKQILHLSASGAKNADIAASLNVSTHTVKTHMYNLFKKINVSNRIQAINWAKEHLPSSEVEKAEYA